MNKLLIFLLLCTLIQAKYIKDTTNEIILDTTTRLMWQDTDNTQMVGFISAISYCEDLELGSYSDWHLPNINQLLSIVDLKQVPTINQTFQYTNSSYYWSGTSVSNDISYIWTVSFDDGNSDTSHGRKDYSNYVRCVRLSDM